jgi:hypothetical protein
LSPGVVLESILSWSVGVANSAGEAAMMGSRADMVVEYGKNAVFVKSREKREKQKD